jgi:uncharacterized protein YjiS (DUF1127 family)
MTERTLMWAYTNEEIDFLSATVASRGDSAGSKTSPSAAGGLGQQRADVAVEANERVLGPLFPGFLRRWRAWLAREAALAELDRLDARLLQDLGIARGDFPAIIDGTFRRPGREP